MKKRIFFNVIVAVMLLTSFGVEANCINSCGSINDGKCNLTTVMCDRETDPQLANCNRLDSTTSGGSNCPPD